MMARFGKLPALNDFRMLRFAHYANKSTLPDPPPAVNLVEHVETVHQGDVDDVPTIFPMDANDQYGCCTIAAVVHAVTVYRALIGERVIPDEADVTKTYFHLTGGVDAGLPMLDVLNHWRKTPIGGEQIEAFVSLNPHDHWQVQQAIALFGGVYLGFQVPQQCLDEFDALQPWTPGKLTMQGHAVYAVGYDADTVRVLTWGNQQTGTWDWWDDCVDEAYAILPVEAARAQFAPGFDHAALLADLNGVARGVAA